MMKYVLLLLGCAVFAACQNTAPTTRSPAPSPHREEMNPQTRNFESAPPYGPRSNKSSGS